MNFLKNIKSREMIEMSLKTILAVLVGLILIILMEGMIYGIYMDKIEKNTASSYTVNQCVAYCEEVGIDEYKVYLHDTSTNSWQIRMINQSKQDIIDSKYQQVVFRTPNAFDVSITGTHYLVMAGFIVAILGFYGWRFYKLHRDYVGFEKKFKKTGKIF